MRTRLTFDHPSALAGLIDGRALLGHRPLGSRQPELGLLDRVRRLHQLDRRLRPPRAAEQLLQSGAALGEGALQPRLVLQREQVERHIHRRRLARQALHARGGRVQALLQRVEVLAPILPADDDLAVEHVAARGKQSSGK